MRGVPGRRRPRCRRENGATSTTCDPYDDDPSRLLDGWAGECGRRNGGGPTRPFQVGWCSWYHYFHDVTEDDLRANLALAGDWPFDVFQLDDGYQAAIGDWLTTNDTFPSDARRARRRRSRAAGSRPGIWLAPFLAAPDVARSHAATPTGSPAAPTAGR